MSEEQRMVKILKQALLRTQDGHQAWTPDRDHRATFWSPVGTWWLRVRSVDEDGQHPFRLSVFGVEQDHGEEIDALTSKATEKGPPSIEVDQETNRDLAALYGLARKSALGTASALDEIERFLGGG
jgi:hypothetical protein